MHPPVERAALVDGRPVSSGTPTIAITAARGDGALETIGVWGGRAFMLDQHLARLSRSLDALAIPSVPPGSLREEVSRLLTDVVGDAALVIHCTGDGQRILTVGPISPQRRPQVLSPQPAPWIQPVPGGSAGPKTMSYAWYLAARRMAQAMGADDALLHTVGDRWILEAPTSGIVMVRDDMLCVPDRSLGIVESLSTLALRAVATDLGLPVVEGRWAIEAVADADAIILTSSLREPVSVTRVGEWTLPAAHGLGDRLAVGLTERRRAEGDSPVDLSGGSLRR